MDVQSAVQILLSIIMAGVSFWVKSLREDIKFMQAQLQRTREEYVHKDDLKDLKHEITNRFDKLEDLILRRGVNG